VKAFLQKAVNVFATVSGLLILIYPCARQSWETCESTINPFGRAPRPIDRWRSTALNRFFGNREDGVSGQCALIEYWDDTTNGPIRIRYQFKLREWPRLRAWLWSAWRNSAHELIANPWPP